MKKTLALLLAVLMIVGLFAGCTPTDNTEDTSSTPAGTQGGNNDPVVPATYTYKDSVSTLATNWNPHTYQNTDDSYPIDFITAGLYTFLFNDESRPVEGMDPYESYVILPEMAAEMPVDVTETVKAEHPEFNIPESATAGYAYKIALNPAATWSNGDPINADTYVNSMELLLNAKYLNYRATDYYAGSLCIAGAEAYAKSGTTVKNENYVTGAFGAMTDLVKGEDGTYTTPDGGKAYLGIGCALEYLGGDALADYVGAYGETYFVMDNWEALVALTNDEGLVPVTDDTIAMLASVISTEGWQETAENVPCYLVYEQTYPEFDFANVGIMKTGEYEITLVFGKSLAGFNLLYNLSGNWIVHEETYNACLTESNGVWTNTYNTSVETSLSYGPYIMTEYQTDKYMKFERNENWYGYTDGKHTYVDPEDGETYDMYQTDIIDTQVVGEAETRKMMFLKGQLMGYGLQAADFATYRDSDYCYATPSETIFFLILNGHMDAIAQREAAADFDQATKDLETMTLLSFRKAVAVTYDKELFASTISPARSGGYGIIGSSYIYDPDTAATYRSTEQAKKVLCDFYSVDVDAFPDLDAAVASITGYDPIAAKELFNQAYTEAIEAGYITDADGDGKSDQTVTIEYCLSADSDFMTQTVDYLNAKMTEVTAGTPFEGKILFIKSAPYGNDWSNKIKQGLADTVLGGWSGSKLDPFGLSDLYTNPAYQYDAAWFDATAVNLTLNINGTDITMNLRQWSDALNGATVEIDGTEYCFGEGIADVDTRLNILAGIEGEVLKTYNYLPMLQDGGMSLLSKQVYYVIEEYHPILGRGGITYLRYNYSDAEWTAYVAEQGGEVAY